MKVPQAAGLAVLVLIPILALFGLFGESWETTAAESAELEMWVRYPDRFRYKMINSLRIRIRNISGGKLDTVAVSFDPDYIRPFSNVAFTPSAARPYTVNLVGIRPGEIRFVHVHMQGEHYGRHSGWIKATAGGADTARAEVSTFIFP